MRFGIQLNNHPGALRHPSWPGGVITLISPKNISHFGQQQHRQTVSFVYTSWSGILPLQMIHINRVLNRTPFPPV
jgi:hypothetical protein